jgi:type IV secretion system protein VirD4
MGYLRLLWRLARFLTIQLPIIAIMAVAVLAILENLNLLSFDGLKLIGFAAVASILAGMLCLIPFRRSPDSHGTARFATNAEIRKAGLRKKGLIIGKLGREFLRFDRPGHLLTFAPTRSGKGVGCVIPNLLDYPGSVFVTDIKGENHQVTARVREAFGPVHAIAPFDPEICNAAFNPLDTIRRGTASDVDDTRLIAEMLVPSSGQEDGHWEREARTLITALLLHIVTDRPRPQQNLAELRNLLMRSAAGMDDLLRGMIEGSHPIAARIADGFGQKEPKERSSIISTAQAATAIFDSPALANVTRRSTFNFERMKQETHSVYLIVPPDYVTAYQPFMRLIVGLATAGMTRKLETPRHPVLFLLDELPALGHMRPIEDGIGYLAGYGARLWLFVQDLDQLQQTYRKWRSMIANCAVRQAFNVQDPATARLLADMLGQSTIRITNEGKSSPMPLPWLPATFSASTTEAGRALLTPDEVMALPGGQQLLFVQGLRPLRAKKVRYFEDTLFYRNSKAAD